MKTKLAVLTIVVLGCCLSISAQSQRDSSKAAIEASFRAATERLMAVIRMGDVARIGEFISPSGIVVGHEQPFTSREQILQEMENKKGFYCVVVGDGCPEDALTMDGATIHVPAYRELLTKKLVTIQREVTIEPDGQYGTLTFTLKQPTKDLASAHILQFVYLRHHWYWNVAWSE